MKIAIDMDGTISGHPEFFVAFINGMFSSNELIVLTTAWPNAMNDGHTESGDYENLLCRVAQLREITGWEVGRNLKIVSILRESNHPGVAVGKGEYCRDNQVDVMFEDDADYAAHVRKISPKTLVFLIQ